jgi:phage portal protein BeeE
VGLLERIADARGGETRDNETTGVTIYDWAKMFRPGAQVNYQGTNYTSWQVNSAGGAYSGAYDGNSVVFACELNRLLLFSEARFQFQNLVKGRPGELFGTPALDVLQEPWVGANTGELLMQMELDAACYGNSYWVPDGNYLLRLDPCRVKILTEGAYEMALTGYQVGEKLLGYAYRVDRDTVAIYEPGQICHYKPVPDRNNRFCGMSWLNPCLPDIDADIGLTDHKRSSVRNGASVPFVVSFKESVTDEEYDAYVDGYMEQHAGPSNSGKVLFLGGGADVKTVGQTFESMAFKATQAGGETRIAACAGVPPVIVGLSEGLSSATYSNYSQARRRLVDGTMRPLWRAAAGALTSVIAVPTGARLWYDDRDIPFLREDVMDLAEIQSRKALTIESLIRAGFEPLSIVAAVAADDLALLKHTGLYSVQLQPPGTAAGTQQPTPALSGNGSSA